MGVETSITEGVRQAFAEECNGALAGTDYYVSTWSPVEWQMEIRKRKRLSLDTVLGTLRIPVPSQQVAWINLPAWIPQEGPIEYQIIPKDKNYGAELSDVVGLLPSAKTLQSLSKGAGEPDEYFIKD